MSTRAQRVPRRLHWPRRGVLWLLAGLVAAAGIALGVERTLFAGRETRSEFMQRTLDGLVTGSSRLAPGATAYVSGPHGTWAGSTGVAYVQAGDPHPLALQPELILYSPLLADDSGTTV